MKYTDQQLEVIGESVAILIDVFGEMTLGELAEEIGEQPLHIKRAAEMHDELEVIGGDRHRTQKVRAI